MRTVQLRRYQLAPGTADEFLAWWHGTMRPTREAWGFTIEFAALDREAEEFTWVVSLPVDAEEFAVQDQAWVDSPERHGALETAPALTGFTKVLVEQHA